MGLSYFIQCHRNTRKTRMVGWPRGSRPLTVKARSRAPHGKSHEYLFVLAVSAPCRGWCEEGGFLFCGRVGGDGYGGRRDQGDMADQADGEECIAADRNRKRSGPHPTENLEDHVPRRYILNMAKRIYVVIEHIIPGKYD